MPKDTKFFFKMFKEEEKENAIKEHDETLYRKHG